MKVPPKGTWICPECGGELEFQEGALSLSCASCAKTYAVERGVPLLVPSTVSRETEANVAQFGASWEIHDHMAEYHGRQFLDWIAPLNASDFCGKRVLEAGCGKGRHSRAVAAWNPEDLFCVDLSEAVFLTERNTRDFPNVFPLMADLGRLPFPEGFFDLVFCVGVLHHMEDPQAGLRSLWRVLKPGGTLCLWVYGREGNGWIVTLVDPVRKRITSRIPTKVLRPLVWPLAAFLYLLLKVLYLPARRLRLLERILPYASYLKYVAGFPFREIENIVLDHLCPPIAHYLTRETLEGWFGALGADSVSLRWHNRNSWNVVAKKAQAGEK